MRRLHNAFMILALIGVACTDKAEAPLRDCQRLLAQSKPDEARQECERAVNVDKTSRSGKQAAAILADLPATVESASPCSCPPGDPLCACLKKRVIEPPAQPKPSAAEQTAVLDAAKQKVEAKFWSFDRDGECTGKGLPAFRKSYEGGTFEEDEMVALGAGCVHLFPGMRDPQLFTVFCCPR